MAEKFPAIESGYQDLDDATSLPNFRLDDSGEVTFSHLGTVYSVEKNPDSAENTDEQSSDTEVRRVRSSSGGEIVYPKGFKKKSRTSEATPVEVGDGPESQDSTNPERRPMTPEESAMLQLVEARKAYARYQAKDRKKVWGRFFQKGGRFPDLVSKIPYARRLSDFMSGQRSRDDNRALYELSAKSYMLQVERKLLEDAQAEVQSADSTEKPRSAEQIKADIRAKKLAMLMAEDGMLESEIIKYREEYSKTPTRFSNWWSRQEGLTGNIKKGAVVVGAGLVVGATLTTGGMLLGVAMPMGGLAASGAATGFGIAKHVTDRRAGSFVDEEHTMTVAEKESLENKEEKARRLSELSSEDEDLADEGIRLISKETEKDTIDTMVRNRRRFKIAMALGGLGAKMGGVLVENVADAINWDWNNQASAKQVSGGEASGNTEGSESDSWGDLSGGDTTPDGSGGSIETGAGSSPEMQFTGNQFTVEYGNGLTHELQEFAQLNGRSLTPEQAFDLHNQLMNNFGDYIQGVDTYMEGGDLRLSTTGPASWKPGVAEFINNYMNANGI